MNREDVLRQLQQSIDQCKRGWFEIGFFLGLAVGGTLMLLGLSLCFAL